MARWVLVAALVSPACGAGAPAPVAAASVRAPTAAVVGLGRIEPRSRLLSLGAPSQDRVERLLVAEGDDVEAGQLLVELRSRAVRAAELASAERRLEEAERLRGAQTKEGALALEKARLMAARARLERLDANGERARVAGLEARFVVARRERERLAVLVDHGATSSQAVDRAAAELRLAEAELEAARARLEAREIGASLSDKEAENLVALAQAEQGRAESEVPIDSLAAEVALAKARLADAEIRAPIAGRVLKIHALPGEGVGDRSVLDMGDVSQMVAVAQVFETQIGLVRVGQTALVSSGALAQPVKGVVEEVGQLIFKKDVLGDDPRAPRDSRVFEVRIRLEPSETLARLTNHEISARIEVSAPP